MNKIFIILIFTLISFASEEKNSFSALEYYENYARQINTKSSQLNNLSISCNNGNNDKCLELGIIYVEGKKTTKDYKKAKEYFKKACDLENKFGCNNLAMLYEKGLGLKKDPTKAMNYYKKSCKLNYLESCNHLGNIYAGIYTGENKFDIKKNYFEAVKYHTKACDGNFLYSCVDLGSFYVEGKGVKSNHNTAKKFLKKACDGGEASGCDLLRTLNYGKVGSKRPKTQQF